MLLKLFHKIEGEEVKKLIYLLLCNVIYALTLRMFLIENQIAAGGFSGLGIVVNHFVPIPIGVLILMMNVPSFIASYFIKGFKFTFKTIIAASLFSFILDSLSFVPTVTHNKILASLFGGFTYGIGLMFSVLSESTAGGTDLITRLLVAKVKSSSVGKMMMFVDGSIVVLAMLAFKNVEVGLYAILTLYTCSYFADKFLSGFDNASLCFIITRKPPAEVAEPVLKKMQRGVTKINAVGMYGGSEVNVLLTAVKPKEAYKVKDFIYQIDPDAFIIVASASEVLGEGFKPGR